MFQKLLAKIASRLDAEKIPYMIIGGQAVLLYGEPRLTKDIDITLGVGAAKKEKLLKISQKLGLKILVDNPDEFIISTMVLPVQDPDSGIRIDFIFSFSPYERLSIKRAKKIKINDVPVKFASLEDLVIHKIVAGRPRDLEDVKNVLLKNPSFDKAYMTKWLKDFDAALDKNFTELFRKIFRELSK